MTSKTKRAFLAALACCAAVGSSLAVTGHSYAGDVKVHPGMFCAPYYYGETYGKFRNTFNGTTNDGDLTKTLNCPILRDVTTDTDGVTVKVRGYAPAGGYSCILRSYESPTGFSYSTTISSPTVAGNFEVTGTLANSYANGLYNLTCSMPPGAAIYSYSVDE
jgi:hypothetical protein